MARRTIEIDGARWDVYPSGRVTLYNLDEFAVLFERNEGAERIRRVTRFSPLGSRRRDAALSELSEAKLKELFSQSQPAWTAPETNYGR